MPYYKVTVQIAGFTTFKINAETPDKAVEIAENFIDIEDPDFWPEAMEVDEIEPLKVSSTPE